MNVKKLNKYQSFSDIVGGGTLDLGGIDDSCFIFNIRNVYFKIICLTLHSLNLTFLNALQPGLIVESWKSEAIAAFVLCIDKNSDYTEERRGNFKTFCYILFKIDLKS